MSAAYPDAWTASLQEFPQIFPLYASPFYAGPVEGTAIGNQAVQMIAAGEFASLSDARDAIRKSFDIKEI